MLTRDIITARDAINGFLVQLYVMDSPDIELFFCLLLKERNKYLLQNKFSGCLIDCWKLNDPNWK